MSPDVIETRIAGVPIQVPIYTDIEHTRRIIDIVNDRLRDIESSSSRIDTQAFALLAAVSFAAEVEDLAKAAERDDREVLVALDAILDGLRDLIRELEDDPPEERP
ncbi:MAG TPA: cell division protein ZapA [Candidatus Hydrogenedentes bacterium]|nr:cell division protein ZapA [Candidatus Hydrogenedentota bacterium]HIJ72541.1 cell division protein ZapA [Candidatus Hydrogenedentota bacterium]